MKENMKPFFCFDRSTRTRCTSCKRMGAGMIVSLKDRLTKAIDGTMARRIFFVCNEKGHLTTLGYSKPVDFNLNLPKDPYSELNLRNYEDEDRELESDWEEMEENARLRRRVFH